MKTPDGVLGVSWGDAAADASRKLGMSCEQWEAWIGDAGFETCAARGNAIRLFGRTCQARLVRRETALEGAQFVFPDCGQHSTELRDAIRDEYGIEAGETPDLYQTWSSGEAVRFVPDEAGGTCTLTVAGPRFGQAYSSHLMATGLGDLSAGLRP